MLNPFAKIMRVVAIVVAVATVAARVWASIYDALAFVAVDRELGVVRSARHPQKVARFVYIAFVAAVAARCWLEGRPPTSMLPFAFCALAGGLIGDRRMAFRAAHGSVFRPESRLRRVVVRIVRGEWG